MSTTILVGDNVSELQSSVKWAEKPSKKNGFDRSIPSGWSAITVGKSKNRMDFYILNRELLIEQNQNEDDLILSRLPRWKKFALRLKRFGSSFFKSK